MFTTEKYSDLTDGLIAWWPFNGNTNDESGNGNNGDVRGSVQLTNDRKGNANSAYSFPGTTSSYIRVSNNSGFDVINSGFSVSLWYQTDLGFPDHQRMIQIGNTDGGNRGFMVSTRSGKIAAAVYSSTRKSFGGWPSDVNVVTGEWTHVVFMTDFNSGVWKIFSNGILSESGITEDPTGYDPLNLSDLVINIGFKSPSGSTRDAWVGKLDDIQIWNRSLNKEAVEQLFNE